MARFEQRPISFGRVSNEQVNAQVGISNALFGFANQALSLSSREIRQDREEREQEEIEQSKKQAEEEGARQARLAIERIEERKQGKDVESVPLPLREGEEPGDKAFNDLMLAAYVKGVNADTKARLEAVANANPDNVQSFTQVSQEVIDRTLKEVPDSFKERFQLDASISARSLSTRISSAQRNKETKEAIRDMNEAGADALDEALRGARFGDVELLTNARDDFIESQLELQNAGIITEEELNDKVENFDELVNAEAQYGDLVTTLEESGIESARDEFRKFQSEDTGLAPKTKEDITRRFNVFLSKFEQEAKRRQQELSADIAAEEARLTTDLVKRHQAGMVTVEELDAAHNDGQGFLDSSKWESMRKEVIKRNAKEQDDIDLTNTVYSSLNGGPPLDPKDKDSQEAVNKIFRRQVQGLQTPEEIISMSAHFAERTGIIPEDVRASIRGLQRSDDPEVVANSARLYGAINDVAPRTLDDMAQKDKAVAQMVNDNLNAGMEPVQAVESVLKRIETNASEREILKAEFAEHKKSNEGELEDFIDEDFDTLFTFQPKAKANMLGDFNTLTESYFTLTGDIKTARKAAWDDLKRVWGPSEVNGEKVMTRYPVEGVYGMKPDEVRSQAVNDMRRTTAVDFILKQEGGFVQDDAGAGPTNFGINQASNKDELAKLGVDDVSQITREQASLIYQRKYWDGINADDLEPDMQLVAFDAAVNMGVGTAKQLLAKADTPEEFTRLRKEKYRQIAKKPGKGKFLNAWLERSDRALNASVSVPENVKLVSDHLTVRGKGSDYALMVEDERGVFQHFRDPDNNIARYRPEPSRTPSAAKQRDRTRQKIEQAKKERSELLVGIENTEQFERRSIVKDLESFGAAL